MRILIDMNLSPDWEEVLKGEGWDAVHWSAVGDPGAKDRAILEWANANDYILLTHDLDFGALLAATFARGPSVIQVRTLNVLPDALAPLVTGVLRQHEPALRKGALVTVEEARARVRILPIQK